MRWVTANRPNRWSARRLSLSEKLPEEQRYVIDAIRAGIVNDTDKAIEAYERLREACA